MSETFAVWKQFQIRRPTYLDGRIVDDEYDIVKFEDCEPFEATDFITGKKNTYTNYCYSIGKLEWNEKEESFDFRSVGLRYLENREDGLEKFILDFANKTTYERTNRSGF